MGNTYFQFKQFRVEQGRCAMKVTTDACIQGAWAPILPGVKHAFDIGAGTGLLSLMLAQRNSTITIDAIEYDPDAALQASENMAESPWHERLKLIEGDVKEYVSPEKYGLIISNPPFFNNSLQSGSAAKSIARHTAGLSYSSLITAIKANLAEDGYISILLPFTEYALFSGQAAMAGLSEYSRLLVKHTPGAPVKRVVGLFAQKEVGQISEETLVIKNGNGDYTAAFVSLLSPFYLDL